MKLNVKKLHPDAILPTYATDGSACFDLYAIGPRNPMDDAIQVRACEPKEVRTGLAFEIPPGHAMLIFSRSGHGFKNSTRLVNCVGVIDSDYRGEVLVKLTRDGDHLAQPLRLRTGDRIAQAMLVPIPRAELALVDELSDTARGSGGFGGTGS